MAPGWVLEDGKRALAPHGVGEGTLLGGCPALAHAHALFALFQSLVEVHQGCLQGICGALAAAWIGSDCGIWYTQRIVYNVKAGRGISDETACETEPCKAYTCSTFDRTSSSALLQEKVGALTHRSPCHCRHLEGQSWACKILSSSTTAWRLWCVPEK
jgi:hypothetical protein